MNYFIISKNYASLAKEISNIFKNSQNVQVIKDRRK